MPRRKTRMPVWGKGMILLLLALALVFISYQNKKYFRRAYRYLTHKYYKTHLKPSDFPEGFEVHGIDVSHFQDVIDWKKLKAINTQGDTIVFRFVYIKATQGLLKEDEMFDENWEDAKDHHLVRGAYHYFLPDRDPSFQASNFISSVKMQPGDLPPAVDIEQTCGKSKLQIVNALKIYLAKIEENYKVKPVIYSNLNFVEDYLAEDFSSYPFWISHYNDEELPLEDSVNCIMWQHSNKADLLGISGNVDADVFTGTETQFDSLLLR